MAITSKRLAAQSPDSDILVLAENAQVVSRLAPERRSYSPKTAVALERANARLIPATAWAQHHAWPPIGGLRHLIFFANTNGFHKVIRRVGRRVLIDEAAFYAWVDEQGAQ